MVKLAIFFISVLSKIRPTALSGDVGRRMLMLIYYRLFVSFGGITSIEPFDDFAGDVERGVEIKA